jgi:hypothetical protein
MSAPWFLYDDDARTVLSRKFNVMDGAPIVLTAGALTGPVQIYVAVGECIECDLDVVWQPVVLCGRPVELSPDQMMIAVSAPGLYCLGDPATEPLVLGPNVNISAQKVSEVPVELNKLCPPLEYDREKVILCTPTGEKVLVVTITRTNAVPGTLPIKEYYLLGGVAGAASVWTGNADTLIQCPDVDTESDEVDYCDNGVSFTRWFVKKDGQPTGAYYDTDDTGAIYTPAGPIVKGLCRVVSKKLIYLEENPPGGAIAISDIIAASGATDVYSVTVKQISGEGFVRADAGNGVNMSAYEVWSWSAISDLSLDNLTSSGIRFDSGSGLQRITAIYS